MSNLSTALWGQLIPISLVISWNKFWGLGSSASLVIHMSGTWAGGPNSYIHSLSPLQWHLRASQGEGRICINFYALTSLGSHTASLLPHSIPYMQNFKANPFSKSEELGSIFCGRRVKQFADMFQNYQKWLLCHPFC